MNKLQQLQQQLREEEVRVEKERERLSKLTPEQRIADLLHSKMCNASHEDQCSWYYEPWNEPSYAKRRYLAKASRLLLTANGDEAFVTRIIVALFADS